MLTIQIKNGYNEIVATIGNIFSLQVEDEVNKGGKIKLKFPTEDRLRKQPLQKGYRISISYGLKIGNVINLFEGYITDIILKTTSVEIQAENWLSYLQSRMIRTKKSYNNVAIKTVISEVFTALNNSSELPIQLGLNDCETKITKDFDTGTSFYDILKYCWGAEPKLICRIVNAGNYHFLECSENAGRILDGVWEYDARNTNGTNIVDWSWKDSMDKFYSYIQNDSGSVLNEEFYERTKLLFENYQDEGALALPNGIAIPSISISRDTDWRNFVPGDRKNIRLLTGYDWLPLQYLGLIQSRKVIINAKGGIKTEIKVSDEYKTDTNILDLVLQNLRGRKNGGNGEMPDMSNYYTKEATNQAINQAVSTKANISHTHLVQDITNFAQAVGALISSALENYVTSSDLSSALSGKADSIHTHAISDITNLSDELSGKANVLHSHEMSQVNGLETALSGKANSSHSHSVNDITGLESRLSTDEGNISDLQTAVGGKADSVHTHNISDINNLQSSLNSKANSSEVYTKTESDNLLNQKANSTHSHGISDITNLQTSLDSKMNKAEKRLFVITEDMVTVTTDSTKGVSPYNASYGYTNITINENSGVSWIEGAFYYFEVNSSMVVASANRNVRVRIGDSGTYIPMKNWANSILAGSSYMVKGRTDFFVYKTIYESGGALHLNTDTSYSTMSVAEGQAGTATSARTMRADYLKQIIGNQAIEKSKDGGQTITNTNSSSTTPLSLTSNATSGSSYIAFNGKDGYLGSFGVDKNKNPQFYNGTSHQLAYSSDIPTKVSDLQNDSLFITNTVNNLANYYTKSETYTKSEIETLISNFGGFQVVENLPTTNIKTNVIYLKGPIGTGADRYEEWIYSNNSWILIGETSVDLTNLFNKSTETADAIVEGVTHLFMTSAERTKLSGIESGAQVNTITGVKGDSESSYRTGNVNITKANIGLGNVDNTSDLNKPISTAVQTALNGKANSTHSHEITDISGLEEALSGKASSVHTHEISQITGLQTALNGKANSSDIKNNTITFRINNNDFQNNTFTLNQSSDKSINLPIDKSTVGLSNVDNTSDLNKPISTATQNALDGKANSTHSHAISDITNLQSTIDGKVSDSEFSSNWDSQTGVAPSQNAVYDVINPIKTKTDKIKDWSVTTTQGKNLDTTLTPGSYYYTSGGPTGTGSSSNQGHALVQVYNNSRVVQIAQSYDGSVWRRSRQGNSTWKEWKKLVDADEIGNGTLTVLYGENDEELGTFGANQSANKTIKIPAGSSINELTENFVRTMIFSGVKDFDNVFRAKSGLYRILNAMDENDNLGLTQGEVWEDIVGNQSDISKVSHSFSVMVAVASSEIAMNELLSDSTAVNEISECWNSISIIAKSSLARDLYLSSENGINSLFTYIPAMDAFFEDYPTKVYLINTYITTIVNNNDILQNLYSDSVVEEAISDSPEAIVIIAGDYTKLNIVKDDNVIRGAIAGNSDALNLITNNTSRLNLMKGYSDITNAISQNQTALVNIAGNTDRLNLMKSNSTVMNAIFGNTAADNSISNSNFISLLSDSSLLDGMISGTASSQRIKIADEDTIILPPVLSYTGLTGYNSFEQLSENESDMAIVEANQNAMKLINACDGAKARFQTDLLFEYTGKIQYAIIKRPGTYLIKCRGAGSNTSAGGYAEGTKVFAKNDKIAVVVGQSGSTVGGSGRTTFGFGGSSNYGSNRAGGGLSGVFTGNTAVSASSSARAIIIAGGAGGGQSSSRAGGKGGGETGQDGQGSSYGTRGSGGTQTGHGSSGNKGANQFNGGNGSGTYGRGGGGGRWGGNSSIGDGSGDDDVGAGGGSGYIGGVSSGSMTQGGGLGTSKHGKVEIHKQ